MDNLNCICKPNLPNPLIAPSLQQTNQDPKNFERYTYILQFEPTLAGTSTKKSFAIKNGSKHCESYVIRRDPKINHIFHVFDFKLIKSTVAPGENLECIIIYSPQVPQERNVDYLQILDSAFKEYNICVKGDCIGPLLTISIKTMYFYYSKNGLKLKNTFELKNVSNVPAIFQFYTNEEQEDQEIFKLDVVRGCLQPSRHMYITVSFATRTIGIFSRNMYCLIKNHHPLMVELIGIYAPKIIFNPSDATLKRYPQGQDTVHGYSGFLFDSVKTTTEKPPFSLSNTQLDFGRLEFLKNEKNSRTLITSLTNHLKEEIEIVWTNDNHKIFSIAPNAITIPAGESVLYECNFQPDQADCLYTKILTGCVYWSKQQKYLKNATEIDIIDKPFDISLIVLGQSFPENKIWLPLVEISQNVILPPTFPLTPTYTTLMLNASGHLPTSFKFISPNKSNYLLKPMQGILSDYQIVAIQLQPDCNNKKAYVERWGIELNGRAEECPPIFLKGYSENTSVIVGNNNIVVFESVHPGCQDILNVMMKNTSIHYLKYHFILKEDCHFAIDHLKGKLASNESIFLQWYCTGDLKDPEVFSIRCELTTVLNIKFITGTPLDSYVTVYSKCAYSQLCALPNSYDFNEIEWGTRHTTEFYLFNFSQSPMHFKLKPKDSIFELEQLTIIPSYGTVESKNKLKILINVKGLQLGKKEIKLIYQVRLNRLSEVLIDDEEFDIFSMELDSAYPTPQIEDISCNNFGPLFTKVTLWEMFNINSINEAMRSVEHDEMKSVEIKVPDCAIGETDFFANFVIRNKTIFHTLIKFKREKICECKPITRTRGFSLRETSYHCVHKDMLKFTLSNENVEPHLTQKLKMSVKYLEHGLTQFLFLINLSHNRQIQLYVNVSVLPSQVDKPSIYSDNFVFKLTTVFVGEKQPPAQTFPLYNNSGTKVSYEIDTTPLKILNSQYDFNIIECLNPDGVLRPFSSKDIIFNFIPIEAKLYEVSTPIKLGNSNFLMKIVGRGVTYYRNYNRHMICALPCEVKPRYMELPIELSTDHLLVNSMFIWSSVQKMVFIKNTTSDRIIGYYWQPCKVEGVVTAEASYRKGVLQPKESHAVIIKINTFHQPCDLRLQMSCKLLDHTTHIRHKESVVAHKLKEELAGQFTITEKGTLYPKNNLTILPKAETFYISLAINICILSIADKDICMESKIQLNQSPQYTLHTDLVHIFQDYINPLLPTGSRINIEILDKIDEVANQKNPKAQQNCCQISLTKENINLFTTIVECIMADALLSKMFHKLLHSINDQPQTHYLQYIMDDDVVTPFSCEEEIRSREQRNLEKQMDLIKDHLNTPQGPILAGVFEELITDSVHSLFQLGPQIKNKTNKQFIYHSTKSKFICPSCKCNN